MADDVQSYYETEEGVSEYEEMAFGHDGRELVQRLAELVESGARVLELGMGPGKDLDLLRGRFVATGSDISTIFLERYRARHPEADLVALDAATIDTERRFDAIYSNKVLQHLTPAQLAKSLTRQADIVPRGGVMMHSFWRGERTELHEGLRFVFHSEQTLAALVPATLNCFSVERYRELEEGDSLLAIFERL